MAQHAESRKPAGASPAAMVKVEFFVPPAWKSALVELAHRQRISVADLLRIMLRGFMRERLTPEQRAGLEVD